MPYVLLSIFIVVIAAAVVAFLGRFISIGKIAVTAVLSWLALTAAMSITIIDNGNVGVEKRFGLTVTGSYGPGPHLVLPWASITEYVILRREFPIQGAVITADNNPLTVNVGFATALNPAIASRIQTTVGEQYFETLVKPAAQTAVRDGIAGFPWAKAVTSDRSEVQVAIQRNFERIVAEQLQSFGLTKDEAKVALSYAPVQLRAATPDAKVLNAVAERSAALEDLERQKTLTHIAEQEALRRKNEGLGVTNLFNELPKGFTSNEIAEVLAALATKTRADAMMKAVESGHVGSIIFNGDVGTGVTAPLPSAKSAQAGKASASN